MDAERHGWPGVSTGLDLPGERGALTARRSTESCLAGLDGGVFQAYASFRSDSFGYSDTPSFHLFSLFLWVNVYIYIHTVAIIYIYIYISKGDMDLGRTYEALSGVAGVHMPAG